MTEWASIRDMRTENASRRMVWPGTDMNILTIPSNSLGNNRSKVLVWVEEHTTGQFYLGGGVVSFKDERDEIMFKLSWKE